MHTGYSSPGLVVTVSSAALQWSRLRTGLHSCLGTKFLIFDYTCSVFNSCQSWAGHYQHRRQTTISSGKVGSCLSPLFTSSRSSMETTFYESFIFYMTTISGCQHATEESQSEPVLMSRLVVAPAHVFNTRLPAKALWDYVNLVDIWSWPCWALVMFE